MAIEDLNPVSIIAGVVGGLLGFYVAGSMMPDSFLMKILVFFVCTVTCYFVFDKVLEG